jgi:hypothetical protein
MWQRQLDTFRLPAFYQPIKKVAHLRFLECEEHILIRIVELTTTPANADVSFSALRQYLEVAALVHRMHFVSI